MNNENELWYPLRRNSFEYALSPILSKDEQKPAPEEVKPAPAPPPATAPAVPEEKLPSLEEPAPAKENKAKSFHTASMQEESAEAPKRPSAPSRPTPAPAPSVMKKPEINTEAPASVQETNGSAEKKRNMRLAVLALCIVIATTAAVVCVSKFGKRLPKAEESVSDSRKDEDDDNEDSDDSRPDAQESATDAQGEQNSAADSQPQVETGASSETMPSTDSAQDPTDPQGGTETQAATEGETQSETGPSSESSDVQNYHALYSQHFLQIADTPDSDTFTISIGTNAGEVNQVMGEYEQPEQKPNNFRTDYECGSSNSLQHKVDFSNILQRLQGNSNNDSAFGDYSGYIAQPIKILYQFTDESGSTYLGRLVNNFSRKDPSDYSSGTSDSEDSTEKQEDWSDPEVVDFLVSGSTGNGGFILYEDSTWEYRDEINLNNPNDSTDVKYDGTYEKSLDYEENDCQMYVFKHNGAEVFRLWIEDNDKGDVFLLEYYKN